MDFLPGSGLDYSIYYRKQSQGTFPCSSHSFIFWCSVDCALEFQYRTRPVAYYRYGLGLVCTGDIMPLYVYFSIRVFTIYVALRDYNRLFLPFANTAARISYSLEVCFILFHFVSIYFVFAVASLRSFAIRYRIFVIDSRVDSFSYVVVFVAYFLACQTSASFIRVFK